MGSGLDTYWEWSSSCCNYTGDLSHQHDFNSCTIAHEFRSSNYEAHNLAKLALTLGVGRHIWLDHLHGIEGNMP